MKTVVLAFCLSLLFVLPVLATDTTLLPGDVDQVPRAQADVKPAPAPVISEYGDLHEPILQLEWYQDSPSHCIGIAWDGEFYWTIGGGNSDGLLRGYDEDFNLVHSNSYTFDGRGIVWNPMDGLLYISTYMGHIVRIDDPYTAYASTQVFTGLMQDGQASFGMSPDGSLLYDFYEGTVEVHEFFTGNLVETVSGLTGYGPGNFGSNCSIVADDEYFYTTNTGTNTIIVNELDGTYVTSYVCSEGWTNGMSLSFTNHMVWLCADEYTIGGTWWAYTLRDWNDGPVQFNLIPQNTTIPPNGGNVVYGVELVSELPMTVPGLAYWTYVTIPNGQEFGPLTTQPFTHTPFMNVLITNVAQAIPALAPAGEYTFTGHIGFSPNPLLSDDFEFEKLGTATGAGMPDPATWPHSRLRE